MDTGLDPGQGILHLAVGGGGDLVYVVTREYIPFVAIGQKVKPGNLGTRKTFADIAATVTELLGVPYVSDGESFAKELVEE